MAGEEISVSGARAHEWHRRDWQQKGFEFPKEDKDSEIDDYFYETPDLPRLKNSNSVYTHSWFKPDTISSHEDDEEDKSIKGVKAKAQVQQSTISKPAGVPADVPQVTLQSKPVLEKPKQETLVQAVAVLSQLHASQQTSKTQVTPLDEATQSPLKFLKGQEDSILDRGMQEATSAQRTLHNESSYNAYKEIGIQQKYRTDLKKELEEISNFSIERSKKSDKIAWIGKGAAIASVALGVAAIATAIASAGTLTVVFGVLAGTAKLVETAVNLGSGIVRIQDQKDQAKMTEIREKRDILHKKVMSLLDDAKRAAKLVHSLWRMSTDLVRHLSTFKVFN